MWNSRTDPYTYAWRQQVIRNSRRDIVPLHSCTRRQQVMWNSRTDPYTYAWRQQVIRNSRTDPDTYTWRQQGIRNSRTDPYTYTCRQQVMWNSRTDPYTCKCRQQTSHMELTHGSLHLHTHADCKSYGTHARIPTLAHTRRQQVIWNSRTVPTLAHTHTQTASHMELTHGPYTCTWKLQE